MKKLLIGLLLFFGFVSISNANIIWDYYMPTEDDNNWTYTFTENNLNAYCNWTLVWETWFWFEHFMLWDNGTYLQWIWKNSNWDIYKLRFNDFWCAHQWTTNHTTTYWTTYTTTNDYNTFITGWWSPDIKIIVDIWYLIETNYSDLSTTLTTDYLNLNWFESDYFPQWPPVLELTATGSTYIREDGNGVDVIFLETNTDFTAEYYVYDDTLDETGVYYGDLGSFSWWLQAFNILNNEYFTFSAPKSYRIELVLSDPNDPYNTIYVNYPEFQYLMEDYYEEPDPNVWEFATSGWIPYWSGVKLSNFVPDPYGGRLYFELIAPNPTGTGTIELETSTDHFYSYDIDGSWYGFDSAVDISYPYHQVAGLYNIRALYKYDNVVVYPFWTWYYNYKITIAESPLWWIENYICDKDSNGIVTQIELDNCSYIQEGNFLQSIGSFLWEIKKFFRELMKIGDTPAKEWGFNFIPTANAELVSDTINLNLDLEQDNILTDVYYFIKWFILFVFLLLWVIIIIIINKKE